MTEGVLGAGARRGRHRERLPEVGPFEARCERCEAECLRVGGAGGGRRGGGQGRRQPCRSQGAEKVLRRCPSNALRWGAAVGAKARRGSHTPGEEGAGRRDNTRKLRCAVGRLRGQGVPDPRPLTPI